MRILQVINSTDPRGGGPIEAIRQAHQALVERGHETEIACLDAPNAPWLSQIEVPWHALGPTVSPYRYSRRFEPWLRTHAPEYDCAIVHGIWLYPSFATWRVFRRLGLPYYVYTHGMLDPAHRRVFPVKHLKKLLVWKTVEHRTLRDATGVFFTCQEERALAQRSFRPFPCANNSRILPYCIGSPPANADQQVAAFLRAFPELRERRLLLFLSRIHPKKGCDLLLDAFAHMAEGISLHLVLAGTGPASYRAQLEHQIRRLGIGDRVTWTGMLQGDEKWGAFRAAEAFILPSHQENFGIAVVEALACGVPVLISNRINIWRELVEDRAGIVGEDTASGTRSLLRQWLTMDAWEQAQMRASAKGCFDRRFSADEAADALLSALGSAGAHL